MFVATRIAAEPTPAIAMAAKVVVLIFPCPYKSHPMTVIPMDGTIANNIMRGPRSYRMPRFPAAGASAAVTFAGAAGVTGAVTADFSTGGVTAGALGVVTVGKATFAASAFRASARFASRAFNSSWNFSLIGPSFSTCRLNMGVL